MQKMRLLGNRSHRKLQKILQIPHLSNTFIRSCVTPGVNHLKIYGIDRVHPPVSPAGLVLITLKYMVLTGTFEVLNCGMVVLITLKYMVLTGGSLSL